MREGLDRVYMVPWNKGCRKGVSMVEDGWGYRAQQKQRDVRVEEENSVAREKMHTKKKRKNKISDVVDMYNTFRHNVLGGCISAILTSHAALSTAQKQ
ncbi:hypothetical protein RJT34_28855 [Clitoria ternatea]|uniref:Uncharacterized protein n=1 Tax=Clitoria ternatea TaxID=43366 RepID=A0AAN9FBS6_CLITE